MVSRRGRAAKVGTYLGPRAFYTKDMNTKARAAQFDDLPPRCFHCRVSYHVRHIDGQPHCEKHQEKCDFTCGRSLR